MKSSLLAPRGVMHAVCVLSTFFFSYGLFAQPSGYVPGTQVCWVFNDNRPHGYFKAAGNGERHILISFTGDGQTNCSNFQEQSPQKLITEGWNGKTVRAPGDTVVWEIFTIPNTSGYYLDAYVADLAYFFQHIDPIDTSKHQFFHVEGLSGGVGRFWGTIATTTSPYRNIFSTTISQSCTDQSGISTYIHNYSAGRRHWVWHGTADSNPYTQYARSQELYSYIQGDKKLTLQSGGGHGANTWDSCMSINGLDTLQNRWLWMVEKQDSVTVPEEPGDSGGPSGYVPGTQVCWTFNNRGHGYFRAAGHGEKHVLIAFTGDSSTNCSNYQLHSPQKLLADAGINWNGLTVRGAGDTVRWEVFTIPYNAGYWLPDYASDIAYFFANTNPPDTSLNGRFHVMSVASGAGTMWGFLMNDQNHNSAYRKIFSTTLSLGSTWLDARILSGARLYSSGRRNWVWYGTGDGIAAGAQQLYDSLSGFRRLTVQTGGGRNYTTWDSCMSLTGSDSLTNRWRWMAAYSGVTGLSASVPVAFGRSGLPDGTIAGAVQVKVYPNPASDLANILLPERTMGAYRIVVADAAGRIVKAVNGVRGGIYPLQISGLPKGTYLLQVRAEGFTWQGKLLKK